VRGAVLAALVFAAGAAGVGLLRGGLATAAYEVKEKDDVYAFPPPTHLRLMTLGYHAAATDRLWAKLLVEYGTHWHERRAFPDLPRYLDAILELDPSYAPLYKYVDTLLVYRPPVGTAADARLARTYLERGLRERPADWHVWLEYGQFIAFIGPGFLDDQAEKDAWRRDGAPAIQRAVDLGADPDRGMAAAALFNRYGQTDAAKKALERALALASDDATREEIGKKLDLLADEEAEARIQRDQAYVAGVRQRYPFLTPGEILLLFPDVDAARCAGPDAPDVDRRCARDWAPRLPSAQ
jgi:tetratricopeptide (TPR) repeat protein